VLPTIWRPAIHDSWSELEFPSVHRTSPRAHVTVVCIILCEIQLFCTCHHVSIPTAKQRRSYPTFRTFFALFTLCNPFMNHFIADPNVRGPQIQLSSGAFMLMNVSHLRHSSSTCRATMAALPHYYALWTGCQVWQCSFDDIIGLTIVDFAHMPSFFVHPSSHHLLKMSTRPCSSHSLWTVPGWIRRPYRHLVQQRCSAGWFFPLAFSFCFLPFLYPQTFPFNLVLCHQW